MAGKKPYCRRTGSKPKVVVVHRRENQIGPKVTVHLNMDFSTPPGTPPQLDLEEQEYMAEESFWEVVLGVRPGRWNRNTNKFSETYRDLAGKPT